MLALSRLLDKDLLSVTEYSRLVNAYQFLRHLEHRLQFEDDRQTHTLPTTLSNWSLSPDECPHRVNLRPTYRCPLNCFRT